MSTRNTTLVPKPQSKTEWPFVSVIIACRNEEWFIARCLDSLLPSGES